MKSARCSYKLCRTGLPGIVTPIASFKAKDGPAYLPRGHAIIGELKICESCAITARVHDLVTDLRWTQICHQIAAAGGAAPDRESLELLLGVPHDHHVSEEFKQQLVKARQNQ